MIYERPTAPYNIHFHKYTYTRAVSYRVSNQFSYRFTHTFAHFTLTTT